ncbi:MAG: DUF1294 domain-containing protein [Clostridiaceae bacterium]|nr:DUF1294 domain-containing protein [Clostridiaceae bacterium]
MNKSIVLFCGLFLWNFTTFLMMGMDKYKARKSGKRISEKTFFISAFLFGAVGIMLGMYIFRHKTKHLSFRVLVPIAVTINFILGYLAWLLKFFKFH